MTRPGSRGRRKRRQRGMTLVEVLIAMVVLAVLAIGAGMFVEQAWRRLVTTRNRRVALELATSRLEWLMHEPSFDDLAAMAGSPVNETVTINRRGGYQMATLIAEGAADDCLSVTVTVQFVPGDPGSIVRLQTIRGP